MEINTTERLKEGFNKGWLQNKTVTYKVISDKFNPDYLTLHPEHKGRFQFELCSTWLKLPLSASDRGLKKILNPEEQAFFEDVLSMPRQSLSFHRTGSNPNMQHDYNFWYGFRIEMKGEESLKLNLADPMDNLRDRILQVNPEIAPNWTERNDRGSYRWVRFDDTIEIKEKANTSGLKMKAYSELEKIKENKLKLIEVLKSLGTSYNFQTETDILVNSLINIIEKGENSKTQLNVVDFLKALTDKNAHTKALITDALSKQLIVKRKDKFMYNEDQIAKGMEELIEWFNDAENQDTRKFIENKTKEVI